MVHAKHYETTSKFVKVMPRILWPLFFPDTVYMYLYLYSYRRETARQLLMYVQLTRCFSAVAELLVLHFCQVTVIPCVVIMITSLTELPTEHSHNSHCH